MSGTGTVWSSGSAGLLGWSFEPGTPLPVPEGSSWRPDWLSKTSPTGGSHQLCCPTPVRAGSLPVPAARQAGLRECVCQCACPLGSCPQTLSGLASPFLLQWLWLNTTGSFTKEDGEGDEAPATPPATASPAWHQSQEHPLLCSGISIPCLLPGSGWAAARPPAALLARRCQKRAPLPMGNFMLE